jgi:hypothetical protein
MLHWQTTTPLLRTALETLMEAEILHPFRLVGGTSLSLQLGHRLSVDIDLFTDEAYDSIDFASIDDYLVSKFPYVETSGTGMIGFGKSYNIGTNPMDAIKLDLYYTDPFIRDVLIRKSLRLASIEEIIAMKVDIVARGGRKKDFWDLHDLLDHYSIPQMIGLHQERYPYSHDAGLIKLNFTNFTIADEDFEPVCLKGKYWELIKLDFLEAMEDLQQQ